MRRGASLWGLMIAVLGLNTIGCRRERTPVPMPKVATTPASATQTAPAYEELTTSEPETCDRCTPVTPKNFVRAETDLYFRSFVKEAGFGKLISARAPTSVEDQKVVRMNRDTLYSHGLFDLSAGPVMITLPDAGKRFMSMQVLDEDEYTRMMAYGKGTYTLTRHEVGTRYAAVFVRTLIDPRNQQDLNDVHKLQDAIKVSQNSTGSFEAPKWDTATQSKVRDALISLASTMQDLPRAFGTRQQTDPVEHLIGAAAGWGGNPLSDAKYVNLKVPNNDGTQEYRVTLGTVPVDGFWSISVYNAKGYFEKNAYGAYSVNNITAQKNNDGTVTVQFGGCDGTVPNCLPIPHGWNATLRLYRPRPDVLNGSWTFPALQPMQ